MKLSHILAIVITLVVAFFMFAPDDRIDAVLNIFQKESPRDFQREIAEECFDFYLRDFRHPDTAEMLDYRYTEGEVFIEVRADNSFGVPSRTNLSCVLDHSGQFSEGLTLAKDVLGRTSD